MQIHRLACRSAADTSRGWGRLMAAGLVIATTAATPAVTSFADPPPPVQDWSRTETRADCAEHNALRNPYFGDTHVHTKYSADAVLARTRNDPRDAYRFAIGKDHPGFPDDGTVGLPPFDTNGDPLRTAHIDRPLDFTAVTDHAEGFGESSICLDPHPEYDGDGTGYNAPLCVGLRDTFDNEYHPDNALPAAFISFFTALSLPNPGRFQDICGDAPGYTNCSTEAGIIWQATQDAAEEVYDRSDACSFTSFVAYEWSGNTYGNNLHRNIIFRNAEVPALPITYYEQWKAEDLWAQLQSQCLDQPGNCDVLAIPHNSNIAQDAMFSRKTSDGVSLTAAQAAVRASFEPVMELTQVKGDSECRDGVDGTSDELCSFEKLSRTTLLQDPSNWNQEFSQYAYARGALKQGLIIQGITGVNPYELGFVGGTDTHNGVPGAVSEIDYGSIGFSGVADSEPAFILAEATPPSKIQSNPGGLSVVWAEENSRDAIFAALRRKETYSTSGTRPIVRSFAGRYPLDLCTNGENFVAEGYDKGKPMGGDIGPVLGKESPRFAVMAMMDNGTVERPGTPLQHIQMIKGWIDNGETFEKVYEIAGNPENGAGVNEATCEETNSANGFPTLCTVWEDPDFDPELHAFYYVRVLEDPVCRWSKRLCNTLGVTCPIDSEDPYAECCDPHIPTTIQERAVASPIWYHPDQLGITKAAVKFGKDGGDDRLQIQAFIPESPGGLDPAADGITLTLRDDATVWTAVIPAGAMTVKKPGFFQLKDKEGTHGGVTGLSIKVSKGLAKIKVKTGDLDLAAIERDPDVPTTLTLDLTSGDYSSTTVREWTYEAPKLTVAF